MLVILPAIVIRFESLLCRICNCCRSSNSNTRSNANKYTVHKEEKDSSSIPSSSSLADTPPLFKTPVYLPSDDQLLYLLANHRPNGTFDPKASCRHLLAALIFWKRHRVNGITHRVASWESGQEWNATVVRRQCLKGLDRSLGAVDQIVCFADLT